MSKVITFQFEDLTLRISKGKFGEYLYRSPRWGYKRAYHYNQIIYIYFGDFDDGFQVSHCFKRATRARMIEWLKEFKLTREYRIRRNREIK